MAQSLRELSFARGTRLLDLNRAVEAITAFKQALKEGGSVPSDHEILYKLASAHRSEGDTTAAFQAFAQAIAEEPATLSEIVPDLTGLLSPTTAQESKEWLERKWLPTLQSAGVTENQHCRAILVLAQTNLAAGDYTHG